MRDGDDLALGLEIFNSSSQVLQDFDVMVNKNPFAIFIGGAANKITLPAPHSTVYGILKCTIDKRNVDAKNAPKCPFNVQIAMKTNIDVYFF